MPPPYSTPLIPEDALAWRQSLDGRSPLGLVLGSGFATVEDALKIELILPFENLPGFSPASVPGHAGRLLLGRLQGHPVMVQSGRLHYYEGLSMEEIARPVHLLADMGAQRILFTNAAGGIREDLQPGRFMILKDHINFMGANPLRGASDEAGPPFLDMTQAYDPQGITLLEEAAIQTGIPISLGVYLAVSGPSYETPAEIRAFRILGADAVGMSTVPEVIVARWRGLKVAALSCITNPAAGLVQDALLDHGDVLKQATRSGNEATRLVEAFVRLAAET